MIGAGIWAKRKRLASAGFFLFLPRMERTAFLVRKRTKPQCPVAANKRRSLCRAPRGRAGCRSRLLFFWFVSNRELNPNGPVNRPKQQAHNAGRQEMQEDESDVDEGCGPVTKQLPSKEGRFRYSRGFSPRGLPPICCHFGHEILFDATLVRQGMESPAVGTS